MINYPPPSRPPPFPRLRCVNCYYYTGTLFTSPNNQETRSYCLYYKRDHWSSWRMNVIVMSCKGFSLFFDFWSFLHQHVQWRFPFPRRFSPWHSQLINIQSFDEYWLSSMNHKHVGEGFLAQLYFFNNCAAQMKKTKQAKPTRFNILWHSATPRKGMILKHSFEQQPCHFNY